MKRTCSHSGDADRLLETAFRLDEAAFRLARGQPAIDVALGEIFLRLSVGNRLIDLGFSKKADFANEMLGLPPRTFFALGELAAGLRERPLLRQAVIAGEVSSVKARVVMERAVGEAEAGFVAAAIEMTVKDLWELIGKGQADPEVVYRTLRWRMTAEQQDRIDTALSLAKEMVGYDAARWKLTEAVAREWLAIVGHAGECDPGERATEIRPAWLEEMTGRGDQVGKQLEAVLEAVEVLEREEGAAEENALGLLAQARSLLKRRQKFDEPLGRVLLQIDRHEVWRWLGYESFGDYCRERLGISESTARTRIRLEKRLAELPPLREALLAGRITYTKALVVARRATLMDVRDQIAAVAQTTWQQTDREAREKEDRADRKAKRRRVHGPAEALRVILRALDSARQFFALRGEEIDDGEALARMGDHFFERYEVPLRRAEWRRRWEKGVLLRHGGLCAVPGCTREAKHIHHIVFREDGGPDIPANCVALCGSHHLRGIHRGRLIVRGRGGEYLVWICRDAELVPFADWITRGADDVELKPGSVAVSAA